MSATTHAAGSTSIPATLNLAITALAASGALACLWLASHAPHWSLVVVAAILFSYVNNTIFSLLHESVHGLYHSDRRINEAAGPLLAAFFPTSFTIQRVSHFGHHQRNRTDRELFDYYLPGQSRWLKTYWLYCLLTGFYWSIIPVAGLTYLVMPWSFSTRWFQKGPARWWGFEPMVKDIAAQPRLKVWLELAYTLGFQAAVFWALDLDWIGWLACYWAFGINWSSLQYTDHAWSRRDVREGAWNLKVGPVTQAVFLNYHYHLVHHRAPDIPWIHLPKFVSPDDPRPSFWKIYLSLWGGARPAPLGPGPEPLGREDVADDRLQAARP